MADLYIITGPAGVGKSTISRKIAECKIKFVVLITDEDTLRSRDKERPSDCQMGERCVTLLNDFKNKKYDKNNFLDISKLTIEETLEKIEKNDKYFI